MKRRMTAILLCLICAVATLVPMGGALAEEGKAYKLNIKFCPEDVPLGNVEFRVFRVAEQQEDGSFSLTTEFQKYQVALDDFSAEGLRKLADTLLAYVSFDDVTATAIGKTDANGVATVEGLQPGMYLVAGFSATVNGTTYMPAPAIVFLQGDEEDGEVNIEAKPSQDSDVETLRVLKIWSDGEGKDRPSSVTVVLLCNGEVYERVTLNADNNWRYTWTELEKGNTWQLLEENVPEGYTVTVELNGITFTVTNTKPENPPEEPPPPPDEPTPPPPDEPTPPPEEKPTPKPPEKLPQTGQLWWPVPVLMAVGVVLIIIGAMLRREKRVPQH